MGAEEVRGLLRAYAALALAHRAAELYAATSPPNPYLSAIINNQELTSRELDVILERLLSEVESVAAPHEVEEVSSAFLM